MISGTIATLCAWLGLDEPRDDRLFRGVSTDTRTLAPGQLFVALKGPRFDGHDHLQAALDRGAAAALVARQGNVSLPQIQVTDTLQALGHLARAWRRQLDLTVVGITGSNGKTTVKEMTASILRGRGPTQQTRGNLNNAIGLPLTLLDLDRGTDYAVIEMGASAPGEIRYLTELAEPDVALLNNAGPAHLEGFGNVAGVARAKAEIFLGLKTDGIAVYNGDDAHSQVWREATVGRKRLEFGFGAERTVRGVPIASDPSSLTLSHGRRSVTLRVPLPGRHNQMNALAASAAALALGFDLGLIQQGIERVSAVGGRLNVVRGVGGLRLVDDTYNANPASLEAALTAVAAEAGEHWLVLGDMAELGAEAEAFHAQAGRTARERGFQHLYTLGPLSAAACSAFGDGAEHHDDMDSLLASLERAITGCTEPVVVLVKGSRSMRMERVVSALGPAGGRG